eukprot:3937487-Rhodomonas_salina.2
MMPCPRIRELSTAHTRAQYRVYASSVPRIRELSTAYTRAQYRIRYPSTTRLTASAIPVRGGPVLSNVSSHTTRVAAYAIPVPGIA